MYRGKTISVVIPAFNEERHIGAVLGNIPYFIDRIYVVNDGSTDRTRDIVSVLVREDKRLVLINHRTNKGVGGAISTGYRLCIDEQIDICAVMAGDDQMDPDELPSLLDPIIEGHAGYTKGNRMASLKHMRGMPLWRRFGNWQLRWFTRISSGQYHVMDPQNGYSAVSIEGLKCIDVDDMYPYYGYCNDLLAKFKVAGVGVLEVTMPARYQDEKSKIRYGEYIPRVSRLLVRNFFWRMRMKFVKNGRNKTEPSYQTVPKE